MDAKNRAIGPMVGAGEAVKDRKTHTFYGLSLYHLIFEGNRQCGIKVDSILMQLEFNPVPYKELDI